jgi:hypothetical protein
VKNAGPFMVPLFRSILFVTVGALFAKGRALHLKN